ncbi:NADP-dependent isocitrate dehydrogenase [Alkalihalobacterium chitinilyticum]|uniref:Isocitrate dehydrogenase [NADP] n=1 Tax=Alkalihalobacterium chitinilyticum TaxID=2980103 RepID=A0ABT5VFM2_9BACI|nr:NADP-dependent isocitrate dehydrogenase [Alkalihalobacterium chitinilyticum]MDE5414246.1 NADP-dependent isocitrate dehydrogenase [Alkalihalobacterium chitinilyticum]
MNKTPITVAYGDGIGPEIMQATLNILEAAGAQLDIEEIKIGEEVYKSGITTGMEPKAWDSLRRTKVFLKAPITTPQGGGYKSLNVTTRKALGLYANVRPARSYHPFVETKHPKMDVVIIRENEEDLYAGIEHRQTSEVYQCLKLISRPGTEKIIRYAFEYARSQGRKKVTCFVKDNIMKLTDGLYTKIFNEVGEEYPDLEKEHWIVDIGAAKLADTPELFDVIVMPNLYGDILSDVAAQISGSVGIAGSANIGDQCAMFEAIHGSAPRRAGQNLANPSGLLQGAVLMLQHIGQAEIAEKVQNAWLKTLEDGIHTYDIFKEGISKEKVGTKEFAEAVIERIGQKPHTLTPISYKEALPSQIKPKELPEENKELVGVDIFLEWNQGAPNILGDKLAQYQVEGLKLRVITNRGVKVYPEGFPETFCTDHWRCRFLDENDETISPNQVAELYSKLVAEGLNCIKTENLYTFNGEAGYSAVHG